MTTQAASKAFPWPTIAVDMTAMLGLAGQCMRAGIKYGLGQKASRGWIPGKDFTAIDCSGFVRYLLLECSSVGAFPDGSVNQGEALARAGFKESTPDACGLDDGYLRVAWYRPAVGIGHIAFWHGGKSLESCGGRGPTRQTVLECAGWLRKSKVFVLAVTR